MKKHTSYTLKKYTVMLAVKLSLLIFSSVSAAQSGYESEPDAETEIICYAAQKQWVCAPADQKQQAHAKAVKLAEQKQAADTATASSQVETTTMAKNTDFDQQVNDEPQNTRTQQGVIDEQIKDFVPRDDVQPVSSDTSAGSTPQQSLVDSTTANTELSSNQVDTPSQTQAETATASQPEVNHTLPSNDFKYWQNNHPEKWSFQVIGTSNRHQLDSFIATHGLQKNDHTIVKTQANSADWWVVLVGLYDSREQALSQRHLLPAQLADQAWVRQVKTIEGEAD